MEVIAEQARKCPHCHSYIDRNAEPKRVSEAADLVIKFVGFTTAAFTILGGLALGGFAFYGYKSFDKLESDLKSDVSLQITKEVEKARADLLGLQSSIRTDFQALQTAARNSIIDFLYSRYQFIFHSLVLEYISEETLSDLDAIQSSVTQLKAGGSDKKLEEMEKAIHAVRDFRSAKSEDLDHALSDLNSLDNNTSVKYRMLVSIHSKRFKQHLAERDKAESDLRDLKDSAQRYYDLNRHTALADMMRAIACAREAIFIDRHVNDEKQRNIKYAEAIDFLKRADKIDPTANSIHYNLAAYYSRVGNFEAAMHELEIVGRLGELRRQRDVEFFKQDRDFDRLWNSPYKKKLVSLYGRRA